MGLGPHFHEGLVFNLLLSRPIYKGCRDFGALTIYTNHPGGNFRSKYSVLQLVQAQNGKITNDVLISI